MNDKENEFGSAMSASEIASLFGEKLPKEEKTKDVDKMTLKEIKEIEKEADDAENIYRIKARIQNLVGENLTPTGEMLVNSYAHVIKSLYDFAINIADDKVKEDFKKLVRNHESMPGNFIAAWIAQNKRE